MERKPHKLKIEDDEMKPKRLIPNKPREDTVASSSDENNRSPVEPKMENSSSSFKTEEEKSESETASRGRNFPSETASRGRNSPSETASCGRNSPSETASCGRNSPSETASRGRNSPSETASRGRNSSSGTASRGRNSPEPSCAICLEQLQNKSFTDSCFHMFCFTCLVEWSKVKPECPLCKQKFKSIVHNVRSDLDYDQYYIRGSENMWTYFGDRRFRFRTTMTAERFVERNHISLQDTLNNEIASHRMRYAPHSVRLYSASQTVLRMPCSFRRQIYEENLWVKPYAGVRIRFITPEFYRNNPGCTHRLHRWLYRELTALLYNENQVTFVMELIMALITRYEITSQEFFLHIQPYFNSRTSHFIHEFYNFAISPYDMESYDRHASYNSLDTNKVTHDLSSSDSDVIPLSSSSGSKDASSVTAEESTSERNKHIQAYKRLKKLVLKRNSKNDSWEHVAPPVSLLHNYSSMSSVPFLYSNPGPSTSGFNSSSFRMPHDTSSVEVQPSDDNNNNDDDDDDDDDVQILNVLKPPKERTPEIVDLLSSDDESKIIVVSSGNESCSDTERGSCVKAPSEVQSSKNIDEPFSSDCVYVPWNEPSTSNSYKIENVTYKVESDVNVSGSNNAEPSSSGGKNIERNQFTEVKKSPTLASAVVKPLSVVNKSVAWIPHARRKRRSPSPTNDDGSSTESCSGFENFSELTPKVKTLKLRSVVAHFSFDRSDERNSSGHRSSHKRRKEKKKKKKKHTHKRKHRIYSDESD
ncbi:E3 ubiquitin-protein ligase Topors-like [Stegodyphus dumicola]|uniref:E3 ubiquitin-protein ligase Topors-like n=1 Tax=Stegodyphus dumicola TaxID=202533 RepID=UPI0015AF1059|nr:E3 ubiquitin-protein ligase Topors-like [Stegodyphus dumicola]